VISQNVPFLAIRSFLPFCGFRGTLGSPGSDLNCLAYILLRRCSWCLWAVADLQITVSGLPSRPIRLSTESVDKLVPLASSIRIIIEYADRQPQSAQNQSSSYCASAGSENFNSPDRLVWWRTVRAQSTSVIVRRIFCRVIFLLLAGLTLSAQAAGDYIRFTQDALGTISAVLAGSAEPCSGSVIFPMGVSSVSLNGNEFDINSFFAILDPPACPSPPQPYEVTASLGNVADGHYTVVWTVGPMNVPGAFDVTSGLLQFTTNTVPTLTLSALSILVAMIAVVCLSLLRRQRCG
jgi:hypothetical protein